MAYNVIYRKNKNMDIYQSGMAKAYNCKSIQSYYCDDQLTIELTYTVCSLFSTMFFWSSFC